MLSNSRWKSHLVTLHHRIVFHSWNFAEWLNDSNVLYLPESALTGKEFYCVEEESYCETCYLVSNAFYAYQDRSSIWSFPITWHHIQIPMIQFLKICFNTVKTMLTKCSFLVLTTPHFCFAWKELVILLMLIEVKFDVLLEPLHHWACNQVP